MTKQGSRSTVVVVEMVPMMMMNLSCCGGRASSHFTNPRGSLASNPPLRGSWRSESGPGLVRCYVPNGALVGTGAACGMRAEDFAGFWVERGTWRSGPM